MDITLFKILKRHIKLYIALVALVCLVGAGLYVYRKHHLMQIKTTEAVMLLNSQEAPSSSQEKYLGTIAATHLANDISQFADTQTFKNAFEATLPKGFYNKFSYSVKNSSSSMVRIVVTSTNDDETEVFADKLIAFIADKFHLKSTDYSYFKSETTKTYRNIATKEFLVAAGALALLLPVLVVWVVGSRDDKRCCNS